MDFRKLNQVVTPVAAAIPEVISLIEQIHISLDALYVTVDLLHQQLKVECYFLSTC